MKPIEPNYQFRVTKYDPTKRDNTGVYQGDEWYCYAQIERGEASIEDCEDIEKRYINAISALLKDNGQSTITATSWDGGEHRTETIQVAALSERLRACLREKSNEQFQNGSSFVHVGYDYHVYVGVDSYRDSTLANIKAAGLFVEAFTSPYLEVD